ncbi:MAG: hypothetical protein WC571_05930 [Candidatus Omnitrophota bacterium]
MKNIVKILVIFMILTLVVGPLVEYVYASTHQGCACCDNKCNSSNKCHENTKICFCGYSAPLQVYLIKAATLPKLAFLGFSVSKPCFAYGYLSVEDIFHPPKTSRS